MFSLLNLSVFSPNARRLLLVNGIFNFVLPLQMIFSGAFIWRQSSDYTLAFAYAIASFVGIAIGFVANGFLLRRFAIKQVYSGCMTLAVLTLAILFFLDQIPVSSLIILGWTNGISMGLYWSNRVYLGLMNTTDDNRNYFGSLELVLMVIGDLVTAFSTGMFIGHAAWFNLAPNQAYRVVIVAALGLVTLATTVFWKGQYVNPKPGGAVFERFTRQWQFMRGYSFAVGVGESCTLVLPPLLILQFIGNESALGIVESVTTVFSILVIFSVGRLSKPEHRPLIVLASVSLVTLGIVCFGLLYSAVGVIIFQACNTLAGPLKETPHRATLMRVADETASILDGDQFTFVADSEFIRNMARVVGAGIFLCFYFFGSPESALRIGFGLPLLVYVNTIWLSKRLNPIRQQVIATTVSA